MVRNYHFDLDSLQKGRQVCSRVGFLVSLVDSLKGYWESVEDWIKATLKR